jgi:hypothetical protein
MNNPVDDQQNHLLSVPLDADRVRKLAHRTTLEFVAKVAVNFSLALRPALSGWARVDNRYKLRVKKVLVIFRQRIGCD